MASTAAPQPGEGRHVQPGHGRSSSTRSRCRSRTCSATKDDGFEVPGQQPRPGADVNRGRRGIEPPRPRSTGPSNTSGRTPLRLADGSLPELALPDWRRSRPRSTWPPVVFIDRCVEALNEEHRSRSRMRPRAKWWTTEMADRVIDTVRPAPRRLRLRARVPDRPRLRRQPA